jgi:hypothetical protein
MAREAAGWLLVLALFYSPWDEGGTTGRAIHNLNWILGAMACLWIGQRLLLPNEKRNGGTKSGWFVAAISGLILVFGWAMALNAHSVADADYSVLLPLKSIWPNGPGSSDFSLSVALMTRVTLGLGCLFVVTQLSRDSRWLLRIWWAIGLAGGSIALLGLLQKATGAPMILWRPLYEGEAPVTTFFATYYYHGNAGAFLNLILPAVLGLAFRYLTRPCHPAVRALWVTVSLVVLVAVFSDTSRMGQFIAVLILLALFFVFASAMSRRVRHLEVRTIAIALLVSLLALWAVTQASHLDQSLGRWGSFRSTWTRDARWTVDKVAIAALPRAGAAGFGPGTFSAIFPYLRNGGGLEEGKWIFLHDDYLQTLLEWGWFGGALWGAIFFGGMVCAIAGLTSKGREWYPRQRLLLLLALVALCGVALHAAVDFPLQISSIELYVATYLGICWGSGLWEGRTQRSEIGSQKSEDRRKKNGRG